MPKLKEFNIDPNSLCSVTCRKEWSMFEGIPEHELTANDLLKILNGKDRCSSTWTEDHPEFAALRRQLSELGYINMITNYWNGDRVLKSFKLNGFIVKAGSKFPSAYPMGYALGRAAKAKSKYLKIL
jgi:hypothetical protein